MENIYIKGFRGVNFIPTVDFNYETGVCELKGESYIENATTFYAPLVRWLKNYITETKRPIIFNFDLRYFNTSSSKCIIDILHILKRYEMENGHITVNWYYDSNEDDIHDEIEEVEDFMIETGVDIKIVPKYIGRFRSVKPEEFYLTRSDL